MNINIPYERWCHLSVEEVEQTFAGAPFAWAIAGGYAVELFLGKQIRDHDDIDVVVYRDEQQQAQKWLKDWSLYAADPPSRLRVWHEREYLPYGIHDIWGHLPHSDAWQMQLMIAEVKGDEWFSRRNPKIRGKRSDLFTLYNSIPCIRIEVQLMYKAKGLRFKDEIDFQACLPQLDSAARGWLRESIRIAYSDTHPWLDELR